MRPHMRNEAEAVLAAIDEVITIGEQAGIPVQISHLKITGERNWGLVDQVIEKLIHARKKGIDLTCDVYPYFSSRTTLSALIPPWAIEGGVGNAETSFEGWYSEKEDHPRHPPRNPGLGGYVPQRGVEEDHHLPGSFA